MKKFIFAILLIFFSINNIIADDTNPMSGTANDVAVGITTGFDALWYGRTKGNDEYGHSISGGWTWKDAGVVTVGLDLGLGDSNSQAWGVYFSISIDKNNKIGFAGDFDFRVLEHKVNDFFFLYLGLGGGLSYLNSDDLGLNLTFNLPLGMRFLAQEYIDISLEAVPFMGSALSGNFASGVGFVSGINVNFGIKFWIGNKKTSDNKQEKNKLAEELL